MITFFSSSSAKCHTGYRRSPTNRANEEFQGLQFGVASGVVPCQTLQVLGKVELPGKHATNKAGENVTCSIQGPHAVQLK
jgi:hypothetical protein